MTRIERKIGLFALLFSVALVGFSSCKKTLPTVSVEQVDGVTLNYDVNELVVSVDGNIQDAGTRVKAGAVVTVEPIKAPEGLKPRTLVEVKVNRGENLVGADKLKVTYTVQSTDSVVSIYSVCEGGYIQLLYNPADLFVIELVNGDFGDDIQPGARVDVKQTIILLSKDHGKIPFKSVTINDGKATGKLKKVGGGLYLYTVGEDDKQVEVKVEY